VMLWYSPMYKVLYTVLQKLSFIKLFVRYDYIQNAPVFCFWKTSMLKLRLGYVHVNISQFVQLALISKMPKTVKP
jgi:hypothetical protein